MMEAMIVLPSGETESDSERTACMTVAGTALYPSDIGILEFEEMAQRKVDQCWTGHDKGKVSSDIWSTRCWKK